MTFDSWQIPLKQELTEIEVAGLLKLEREIESSQSSHIKVGSKDLINMCANNYLGLSNHPEIIEAAKKALDQYGYGTSSVRFICGTQDIHRQLETEISQFLGFESAILFGSCFDANGGVFEVLLGSEDAVISDALNHASIIDGIRLSKAKRYRYSNSNMKELEEHLIETQGARRRFIVTDGVFSMDGYVAKLNGICDLAEKYDALVMVDDSHAVGHLGENGRGTPELIGVEGRIDLVSGTFGKALGGASGGYIAGRHEIVDLLRQKARPYLFSNSVPPSVVEATRVAIKLLSSSNQLRENLIRNTELLRKLLTEEGFDLLPGQTPIIPVMFGEAPEAVRFANKLFEEGVFAMAFSYPVVPYGKARIRLQVSAAHSEDDIRLAAAAFVKARHR